MRADRAPLRVLDFFYVSVRLYILCLRSFCAVFFVFDSLFRLTEQPTVRGGLRGKFADFFFPKPHQGASSRVRDGAVERGHGSYDIQAAPQRLPCNP